MKKQIALIAAVSIAGSASAGIFTEIEDNDTLGVANDIGIFDTPGGTIAIDAYLGDGDVDWFRFTISSTASLSFFAGFGSIGDGVMQIVTEGGDVIAFDDDSGVGAMPAIQLVDLAAGSYFVGFSGFGDAGIGSIDTDELFDGIGHSEDFAYKLSIGFTIPAPGALALLGMGGVVMTRRRR